MIEFAKQHELGAARANLAFEACTDRDDDGNGVVDENCDHRLWAWNADAETVSMGFAGDGVCDADDICAGGDDGVDTRPS